MKKISIVFWTVFILLGVALATFVIIPDGKRAFAEEKKWEENVGKYVHVQTAGIFRGRWAYIVTDKAGNQWFVSDDVFFQIHDK